MEYAAGTLIFHHLLVKLTIPYQSLGENTLKFSSFGSIISATFSNQKGFVCVPHGLI